MSKRIRQQEAITGIDRARKYAEDQKKYVKFLYAPLLKDVKALKLDGDFLEIGAGPGLLSILIAERNPNVNITIVDISSDMVTVADEYVKAKNLQNRIHCLVVDANDESTIARLGQFDLVYSTFSMHHWKEPVKSISNLWSSVEDNGLLYIYDFKRVWWLSHLPIKSGDIDSIRASYTPLEIRNMLKKLNITNSEVKTRFPFFIQSIIACKK
jgi:SAM-dependent methyltransferase